MNKKILLIQFRTDQSREQEQRCFHETIEPVHRERLKIVNAIDDALSAELLVDVSHVFLGGSGEFFLGEGAGATTWLQKVFVLIDELYAQDVPVFGICFGHQILLMHAGAKIHRIPEMKEVGTLPVFLQPSAKDDPLFKDIPDQFSAIFAHQETPTELPSNIQVFASSERVVAGAIRVGTRRAWGVMFHPDMNLNSVRERFSMFPHYADDPSKFEEALASFNDAPIAQLTIKNFLAL